MPLENPVAIEEYCRMYDLVQNHTSLRRYWQQILSPEERQRLGDDLVTANSRYFGPAGMWARLHGGTGERAVLVLARQLGFADDAKRDWLLRELGEEVPQGMEPKDKPRWDPERRELRLNGRLARRVLHPKAARNVVAVLDAFEQIDWPPRIDSPLGQKSDGECVNKTVNSLNTGLQLIRFSADGTGKGFAWRKI